MRILVIVVYPGSAHRTRGVREAGLGVKNVKQECAFMEN